MPAAAGGGALTSLTRDGAPVAVVPRTVKGVDYAVFAGEPGAYVATYPPAAGPSGPSGGPGGRARPHQAARHAAQAHGPRAPQRPRHARGRAAPRARCAARSTSGCSARASGSRASASRSSGGKSAKVRLRLSRSARRQLATKRKLKVAGRHPHDRRGGQSRDAADRRHAPRAAAALRPCGAASCSPAALRPSSPWGCWCTARRRRAVDACAAPANEIVAENCKPGTPPSVWDVPGGGSGAISGFTTDISTAQGGTVSFKVKSAAGYRIDLYRLGWYGGNGARQVGTIGPLVANDQSPCPANATTGRIACPWSVTAAWSVPADAVSGVYLAHLVAADGAEGHIPFVVRDDDGGSDVLVPDLRHHVAGLQPVRRQLALRRPARRPGVRGQLRPAVHDAHDRPGGLRVQRRVPDAPLAGAQRLRRELLQRGGHGPARRGAAGAPHVPVRRPRRVLVRRSSAATSRPRATPA